MTDVFISYSRGDRDKVRVLAEELERHGLTVWWDSQLTTGSKFRAEIAEKLDEARLVIVIWSRSSVASRFVCDEADEGARRGALFPALIELVDIPLGFRQIQTADLTGWRGRPSDPALQAFIGTIVKAAAEMNRSRDRQEPTPQPPSEPTPEPRKPPRQPRSDLPAPEQARHTVTGRRIRTKLLLSSFALAALIGAGFAALAYSSDFVFPAARPYLVAAIFLLVFLARLASFFADKAMGPASLRLLSGSFVTVVALGAITIAPIVMEGRLYAGALEAVRVKGVEGADINGVALSPDGTRLVTASDDGEARLWDSRTGVGLGRFSRHTNWVWSADFSPDGTEVVTASRDLTARVWASRDMAQRLVLEGHGASVYDAKFSPDGGLIASASGDGTVRLWDAADGDGVGVLRGHSGDVRSVAFAPDGRYLVSGGEDGTVRLWNMATMAYQRSIGRGSFQWNEVAFSGDGERIAGVSDGGQVRVWSFDGDLVLAASVPGKAFGVAFGGNDARLAVGSIDGGVRVFDIASGSLLLETAHHDDGVRDVDGDPQGSIFASGSRDNTARIWDAATGRELAIVGHVASAVDVPVVLDLPPVAVASRAPQPMAFAAEPRETAFLLAKGFAIGLAVLVAGLIVKGIISLTPARRHARLVTPTLGAAAVLYLAALMLSALPLEATMLWATLCFAPATALALVRWLMAGVLFRRGA